MTTTTDKQNPAEEKGFKFPKLTTMQLINFCIGFFGLQFAWQMRILLSGPVTESLGASPFLFSLIWLAGPFTGLVVQPVIGAISDNISTPFGRRKPFLLGGAILCSLALWAFPNSGKIADFLGKLVHSDVPIWGGLLIAALLIWVIDACINASQGPYRALVPDTMPQEQHALANSYLSLSIGLGSVVASGAAWFIKTVFNYQLSVETQFVMAALAFSLAVIWTCITTKEYMTKVKTAEEETPAQEKQTFLQSLKAFFSDIEVYKVCAIQFFTWMGVISMLIYFTNFSVHNVFGVPDLTSVSESVKQSYEAKLLEGTNFSSFCFAIFNLVCFLCSIPIGILASKFGNKKVHTVALLLMAAAFTGLAFTVNQTYVAILMGLAGVGWASLLALPFAMLSEYIQKGTEGSAMGIFNLFIAGPQVISSIALGAVIARSPMTTDGLLNYHWEYAFLAAGICILIAAIMTPFINEKKA